MTASAGAVELAVTGFLASALAAGLPALLLTCLLSSLTAVIVAVGLGLERAERQSLGARIKPFLARLGLQ